MFPTKVFVKSLCAWEEHFHVANRNDYRSNRPDGAAHAANEPMTELPDKAPIRCGRKISRPVVLCSFTPAGLRAFAAAAKKTEPPTESRHSPEIWPLFDLLKAERTKLPS